MIYFKNNIDLNDVHIMEVANQAGVNLQKEMHLLVFVIEFMRTKDKMDQEKLWIFRKNLSGFMKYWILFKLE